MQTTTIFESPEELAQYLRDRRRERVVHFIVLTLAFWAGFVARWVVWE